MYFELQEFKTV